MALLDDYLNLIRRGETQNLEDLFKTEAYDGTDSILMLHLAVKLGHADIVKNLVTIHNINPTTSFKYVVQEGALRNAYIYNALHIAAFHKQTEIMELLVSYFRTKYSATFRETVNNYAIKMKKQEKEKLSLIAAELEMGDTTGTPIYIAAKRKCFGIVEHLIDKKQVFLEVDDPNNRKKSLSLLDFAAQEESGTILQCIINKRPGVVEKHKELLAIAIENCKIEPAKILLQLMSAKFTPENLQKWFAEDAKNHNGESAMYRAVEKELLEVITALRKLGQKGDVRCFTLAVEKGNYEIVKALEGVAEWFLAQKGVMGGKTPLRIAVEKLEGLPQNSAEYYERLKILFLILNDFMADTSLFGETESSNEKTALFVAVEKNLVDAVKLLTLRSNNANIKCVGDLTPLELAQKINNPQITRLFALYSPEGKHGLEIFRGVGKHLLEEVRLRTEGITTTTTTEHIIPVVPPPKSPEEQNFENTKNILELSVKKYVNSSAISSNTMDVIRAQIAKLIQAQQELQTSIANMSQEQKDINLRLFLIEQRFVPDDQIEAKIAEINNDPYQKAFLSFMQQEFSSNFLAAQVIYSGVIHCDMLGNLGKAGQVVQVAGNACQASGIGAIIQGLGAIMSHLDYNQQKYNVMNFCRITSDVSQMHKIATLLALKLLEKNLHIEEHEQSFLQKMEAFITKISNIRTDQVLGLFRAIEIIPEQKSHAEKAGEKAAKIAAKLIITKIFEGKFDKNRDFVEQFSEWVSADFSCLDNSEPITIIQIENDENALIETVIFLDHPPAPISLEQKSHFSTIIKSFKNILQSCCKSKEDEQQPFLQNQTQEIGLPSYGSDQNQAIDISGDSKSLYNPQGSD
jgi:ankyrin repeat protein